MTQAQPNRMPRPCLELGVCQSRKPLCSDCEERPLQLAPGVIDGPHRRQTPASAFMGKASHALANMAAWFMGPHP